MVAHKGLEGPGSVMPDACRHIEFNQTDGAGRVKRRVKGHRSKGYQCLAKTSERAFVFPFKKYVSRIACKGVFEPFGIFVSPGAYMSPIRLVFAEKTMLDQPGPHAFIWKPVACCVVNEPAAPVLKFQDARALDVEHQAVYGRVDPGQNRRIFGAFARIYFAPRIIRYEPVCRYAAPDGHIWQVRVKGLEIDAHQVVGNRIYRIIEMAVW